VALAREGLAGRLEGLAGAGDAGPSALAGGVVDTPLGGRLGGVGGGLGGPAVGARAGIGPTGL
jgi:hypothetical protein